MIDRKTTQGMRREVGQRYHERKWMATATYKEQNRNFFTFLSDSITPQFHKQPAPTRLST